MRTATAFLAACALSLATPCRAQGDDRARCTALLEEVAPLLSQAPTLAAAGPEECTFAAVQVRFGGRFGFAAGALVLHGPFAASPAPAGADGPVVRRLELRDVTTITETQNTEMNWLFRQQQIPFEIVLDTSEDPAAHTFTIREFRLQGEDIGQITLDAAFEGVGPDSLPGNLPDLSEAGLRSVHLRSDSKRFALKFLLGALVGSWHEGDPEAEMAQTRVQMADMAQDFMHVAHTAPGSIDAVLGFIREFPKPMHVLDVSITASGGPVTADDADQAASSHMGLAEVLTRLQVKATYDGAAH